MLCSVKGGGMIERISGVVLGFSGRTVVVDVSGVAFGVQCSRPERYEVGKTAAIQTAFIWNQEKGPLLYGFSDDLEKQLFGMLISCPKIGPSVALQILSQMTPGECIAAIARSDAKALSSLHGIGAKKAAQIITDLQEQCAGLKMTSSAGAGPVGHNVRVEVSQALESLGYTRQEIAKAFQALPSEDSEKSSFDQILRACLKVLATNK